MGRLFRLVPRLLPILLLAIINQQNRVAAFSVLPTNLLCHLPYLYPDPLKRGSIGATRYVSLSAAASTIISSWSSRRDFFLQVSSTTTTTLALVEGGEPRMTLTKRPKAPLGALVPAVQQRLLLDECLAVTAKIITTAVHKSKDNNNQSAKETYLQQLQGILPSLSDAAPTKQRPSLNSNNKDLAVMLQYNASHILSGNIVRAAMNIYTANLDYYYNGAKGSSPSYNVGDQAWKKSYIRANNGLPDVQRVIQADLEVRDLYRNQVQLKLEDASAELQYQLHAGELVDLAELRVLLQEAAAAFDLWMDKIADDDVKAALHAALEGKSLRVYDSYYAGFMPPAQSATTTSSSGRFVGSRGNMSF